VEERVDFAHAKGFGAEKMVQITCRAPQKLLHALASRRI